MFGMNGRNCITTVANGRVLMKDRELIGIDEEKINAEILKASKDLWKKING